MSYQYYKQPCLRLLLTLILSKLSSSLLHGNVVVSSFVPGRITQSASISHSNNKFSLSSSTISNPRSASPYKPKHSSNNNSNNSAHYRLPDYLIQSMNTLSPTTTTTPKPSPFITTASEKKKVHLTTTTNTGIHKLTNLNIKTNFLKRGIEGLTVLTSSTILFKIVSNNILRQKINQFFLHYPFISAFLMCAMKASFADFIAQKISTRNVNNNKQLPQQQQQRPKFEYKRNIAFLLYGGIYQGCVNEYIFNHIYPSLFGSGTDIVTASMKVLLDQLFTHPCICLPVAYIVKGGMYQKSVLHSIKRYMYDIKENKLLTKSRMCKLVNFKLNRWSKMEGWINVYYFVFNFVIFSLLKLFFVFLFSFLYFYIQLSILRVLWFFCYQIQIRIQFGDQLKLLLFHGYQNILGLVSLPLLDSFGILYYHLYLERNNRIE